MNNRIGIAAVGDTTQISTFSGTPFHFLDAALKAGWNAYGWRMSLAELNFSRYLWNIKQLIRFQNKGGYQYSQDFSDSLDNQIPEEDFKDIIISFNQHYPRADKIINNGGKIYHYIDGTFTQLIDRYEIGKIIGSRIRKETLLKEKEFFEKAHHIVTFQNWAKDSVVNDYNIPEQKVSVILPGANFILPADFQFEKKNLDGIGKEFPLILGFIGKDWKRKGLEIIIESATILLKKGYKVEINCAGYAPKELLNNPMVRFSGFINKSLEPHKFISFLQSCHIGCLFSKAEFSSISVFEFIRAGIPVAGYVVDGMGDLYFPETSIRFNVTDKAPEIAEKLILYIENDAYRDNLQKGAIDKSSYVTWERCINEWNKILAK